MNERYVACDLELWPIKNSFWAFLARVKIYRGLLTPKIKHVHLLDLIWEQLQTPTTTTTTTTTPTTPDATVQPLGRQVANELSYPKLSFHAGGGVCEASLGQPLYVRVEIARGYLSGSTLDGLEHGVVYENILVLGLHHVVTLCAQARHVTIDVDRLLVSDPLQHRVDDDERPRATDARTRQTDNKHFNTSAVRVYSSPFVCYQLIGITQNSYRCSNRSGIHMTHHTACCVSSTKPEVHNLSLCRQRTGPRP